MEAAPHSGLNFALKVGSVTAVTKQEPRSLLRVDIIILAGLEAGVVKLLLY